MRTSSRQTNNPHVAVEGFGQGRVNTICYTISCRLISMHYRQFRPTRRIAWAAQFMLGAPGVTR